MNKKIASALLLTLCVPAVTFAASFDCAKASSKIEKKICSDELLSALDTGLAERYQDAIKHSNDKAGLKAEQITWLKSREACNDVSCLTESYKTRIEVLRKSVTTQIFKYALKSTDNPLALAHDNGVCKAFLDVINTTPYEKLFQDTFAEALKGKADFEPLEWQYIENGEERFDEILEKKAVYDEKFVIADKKKSSDARIESFRKYKANVNGFKYYLSKAKLLADADDVNKLMPILLYIEKNYKYPDTRPTWKSIYLTEDQNNFWHGEGDYLLESYVTRQKVIFKYKGNYFSADVDSKEKIYIGTIERSSYSICTYILK